MKQRFLDDRLRLDTSAFHVDWRNVQQSATVTSCGFGFVFNAGAATSRGFDLAAQAAVMRRLQLGISVGYTRATFDETVTRSGRVIVDQGSVVGTLPAVPSPWIVASFAEYRFPVAGAFAGELRIEAVYRSRNTGPFSERDPGSVNYWPALVPDPATHLARIRLGLARGKLTLAVAVDNLLNTQPTLQRTADAPDSSLFYAATLQPRTYSVSLNWRLGAPLHAR
jgi:outer membrane receptor protein involved in Fe transport